MGKIIFSPWLTKKAREAKRKGKVLTGTPDGKGGYTLDEKGVPKGKGKDRKYDTKNTTYTPGVPGKKQ